ncbi:calcium-binding protein [Albimonas sp. CAU 1670]|uniref:calcium-binding protein n=1 Tax=Albimonas sp. CAU 1670 TaxID=3032599 RepID=UPI0023DA7C29|nr:calcium-binding protein [Albimonas sp. CAU 1670]MDF2234501.1 calcium-binding protein [Albimonas sp. CAU 1670]
MVRLVLSGADDADLIALSAGFGRDGPGVLTDDGLAAAYRWTTRDGREALARGETGGLTVDLSDQPSGRADLLRLDHAEDGVLRIEAERPSIRLARLAAEDPPGAAFDPILNGADRFEVSGRGDARLFGDALSAAAQDRGRGDLFQLEGAGGRQATGDFWLIPSTAFQVRGGADDFQVASRGALHLWGDAAMALDKAGYDGALIRGGDDRLDAGAALSGVRRPETPVMVGDVGAVGVGWLLRGGDDLLIAPRGAGAAMSGDVLTGDGQSRLVCGDDLLRGGRGRDLLIGDAQDLLEPLVRIRPGDDALRGGRGNDALHGDARFAAPETVVLGRDAGADRLFGGEGRDRAWGGWSDDRIFGGDDGDRLHGDAGADRIEGGADADRLWGGAGADRLAGGAAADRLFGGGGRDAARGGGGGDVVAGGGGDDLIEGNDGRDRLRGDLGRDRLVGGAGDDDLRGGAGKDRLAGGGGDDRLDGGAGADRLLGGAGADLFRLAAGGGRDRVEDFDPAEDGLWLPRGAEPLQVAETARGVSVELAGAELMLLGVTLDALEDAGQSWLV